MTNHPSKAVTVTSPDGTSTTYTSMRIAAEALGITYNYLRVLKAKGCSSTKGYALKFDR